VAPILPPSGSAWLSYTWRRLFSAAIALACAARVSASAETAGMLRESS
jgi:hypothetical protein